MTGDDSQSSPVTSGDVSQVSVTAGDMQVSLSGPPGGDPLPRVTLDDTKFKFSDNRNSLALMLASKFLKESADRPFYWDNSLKLWFYREPTGLWKRLEEPVLVNRLFDWLLRGNLYQLVEENLIKKIVFNLQNLQFRELVEPNALLFRNGVFFLESRDFTSVIPEDYFFTWRVECDYEPDLTPTSLQLTWLDHLTGGDEISKEIVRLFLAQVL